MSKREEVANQIGEWLITHKSTFDAPYGVIPGFANRGKGKIRTITFGVARHLDAVVEIWSPILIRLRGQGRLARTIDGQTLHSAQDVIDFLSSAFNINQ